MRKFLFLFVIFVLCISLFSVTCFAASGSLGESVEVIGGWEFINTAGISSFTGHFSDGTLAEPLYIAIDSKPQGAVRWRHNMYDFGIHKEDDLVYQVGGTLVLYNTFTRPGTESCRVYLSLASGVLDDQNVTQQVAPWGFSITLVVNNTGSGVSVRVRPFQSYSPIYDDRVVNLSHNDFNYSLDEFYVDDLSVDLQWYIIADSVNHTQELFFLGNGRVIPVMKLHASDTVYTDLTFGCYDTVYPLESGSEQPTNMWECGFFYYSNITYGYQAGYEAGYSASFNDGYRNGYDDGYVVGTQDGITQGQEAGYDRGYAAGYGVGIRETGAALDIPDIITTIMQFTPTLFNRIFGFELFGINVAGVLAACLIIPIVIFVIGKVKHFL